MRLGVCLLGSTGSIGRQTLEVVAAHPDRLRVVALAARTQVDALQEQVRIFRPELVAIAQDSLGISFPDTRVVTGPGGLVEAATYETADIVVIALSGNSGIEPTLAAAAAGKTIALANKESVVCAGPLLRNIQSRTGCQVRPVDSEHSALWQLLQLPHRPAEIARVILTASGGPFRDRPLEHLNQVTPDEALAHPTWRMGPKITIDSATLLNKGLELIEAHWLFDLPFERLDVVIHPQSIVHALLAFVDGSTVAHAAYPDMRLPIQYALFYPERVASTVPPLDLARIGPLEFFPPDTERFPALPLAREVGIAGSTYPTVLCAADEIAVEAFLAGQIRFTDIVPLIRSVLDRHQPATEPLTLEAILAADRWARSVARKLVGRAIRHA